MSELDTLLKRFAEGEIGEEIARENVVLNKPVLVRRLNMIDTLRETSDWNSRKYAQYREPLLAYFAAGCKLLGCSPKLLS